MTKNNYKRLGDYIKKVNVRNTENLELPLMGLSIQKCFIPSIANTIGTNMKTYKIIERDQFAYGPVTSRNGDKITIALFDDYDKALISQAYIPFEIEDKEKLLPKYLMMWFSRPEFDRYARFKSHGSARETFDWEEMCDVKLPIPSIEKQREIVADYQAVENKIKTNEAICEKLEETAQTIYRRWFVNNEKDNWEKIKLGDVVIGNPETLSSKDNFKSIQYLDTSNITNNKIDEIQNLSLEEDQIPSRAKRKVKDGDIVFSTVRPALKHYGLLINPPDNLIVSTGFAVLRVENKKIFPELIYSFLTDGNMLEALQTRAEMSVSTYPSIKLDDLLNLDFSAPDKETLNKTRGFFEKQNNFINLKHIENQKPHQLQSLLLGRMTREEELEIKI